MGGAIDKGHQEPAGGNQMKDFGSNLVKGLKGIGSVINKGLQIADTVSGVLPGGLANKVHGITSTALGVSDLGQQAFKLIGGKGGQRNGAGGGSENNSYITNPPENMGSRYQQYNPVQQYAPEDVDPGFHQWPRSDKRTGEQFDGGSGQKRQRSSPSVGEMGTITQNLGEGRTMLQNKDVIRHSKTYLDNSTEFGLRPTNKITYGTQKKQPITQTDNFTQRQSGRKREEKF